jgi:hypothetical protein
MRNLCGDELANAREARGPASHILENLDQPDAADARGRLPSPDPA